MKLFFVCILAIYHQVLSVPTLVSNVAEGVKSKEVLALEKIGNIRDNNYFQASEQTFYVYDCPPPKEVQTSNIPHDYIIAPGIGAYKFHVEKQTWNQARNTCIKEGGHLAVIRSLEEKNFVDNLNANVDDAWVGLHELFQKDDWVTVQDEPLKDVGFAPWRAGEPNNWRNLGEHCVSYTINHDMNDVPCDGHASFYCKIELE